MPRPRRIKEAEVVEDAIDREWYVLQAQAHEDRSLLKLSGRDTDGLEGLSPRKALFVLSYMEDFSHSRAAEAAGYERSAGAKLIHMTEIRDAIEIRQSLLAKKFEISARKIWEELAAVAFSNIMDITTMIGGERVIDLRRASRVQMAAIASVTVEDFTDGRGPGAREVRRTKVTFHPKLDAIKQLVSMLKIGADDNDEGDVEFTLKIGDVGPSDNETEETLRLQPPLGVQKAT